MKRWVVVVLASLLVLSMVGCGQETQQDPLVQMYKEAALKYIMAGETDKAVAILEDGLLKTNQNSEIAAMLGQAKAQLTQTEETEPTDAAPSGFVGYWESENHFIGIQEQEGKLLLSMLCYSEYYDEYVVISSVEASAATETKVIFPFDDDGCGNSGKVALYLEDNMLNYVITDFVSVAENGVEPYGIGVSCGGGSLYRVEEMPEALALLEDISAEETVSENDDVYVGDWADYISERATMTVTKTAGKYSIKIEWPDSASETTVWTMTAVEKQEGGDFWLESNDCKKTVTVYTEDGFVSKEVEYEKGKANIFYMDETLNWVDYTEYVGDDCCFERIS